MGRVTVAGTRKGQEIRVEGTWWRFSAYKLRGQHVTPARGATLEEYQLFGPNAERQMGPRKDSPAPYEELIQVNIEDPKEILGWCNKYGLLGILPHCLMWAHDRRPGGLEVDHLRSSMGWDFRLWHPVEWYSPRGRPPESIARPLVLTGPLYESPEDFALGITETGSAEVMDLFGDHVRVLPAAEVYSPYFPKGQPEGGYPLPLSRDFWAQYAEPLHEIRTVILAFRQALEGYRLLGQRGPSAEVLLVVRQARKWLRNNAVLQADTQMIADAKKRKPVLITHTLISALATMFWLDWAGGKDVRVCADEGCSRLFVTALYNREYCSETCKYRANKRTQRQRKRSTGGDRGR